MRRMTTFPVEETVERMMTSYSVKLGSNRIKCLVSSAESKFRCKISVVASVGSSKIRPKKWR